MSVPMLSNADKIWLYQNGYYCMQEPSVLTCVGWDTQAWIRWIDTYGSWGHNALKMRNSMYTEPTNTGSMPNGQA